MNSNIISKKMRIIMQMTIEREREREDLEDDDDGDDDTRMIRRQGVKSSHPRPERPVQMGC